MWELLGAAVNAAAIIAGAVIGLLCRKGINERVSDTIFKGLGLCVTFLAIEGAICGANLIIVIVSIALGAVIGELLRLDKRMDRLGGAIEKQFNKFTKTKVSVTEGFVSSSMLFCVGAMAIVGALQSGLSGDHTTQFTKSVIDGISAIIFASTMGVGVIFSGFAVLIYQGAITLLASRLEPLLTAEVINNITCTGYIIIIAIGINMLGISEKKFKVINYVPAVFLPLLICPLVDWVSSII